jgi:transposase
MNKYTEIFGVDISKEVFDVYESKSGHKQFKNDASAFKSFLKSLPKESLVIIEATGYYHYRLAQLLCKQSECLQLFRLMDSFIKKRTATKNKLHGEEVLGIPSSWVHRSLKRDRKHLDKEILGIEIKLLS